MKRIVARTDGARAMISVPNSKKPVKFIDYDCIDFNSTVVNIHVRGGGGVRKIRKPYRVQARTYAGESFKELQELV